MRYVRIGRSLTPVVGILALLAGLMAPSPAAALNSCNGVVQFSYTTGKNYPQPVPPGTDSDDLLTVQLTLGAGTIQNGTVLNLHQVNFDLDCLTGTNGGTTACTDDGAVIAYGGDGTVTTDCLVNGNPVQWVSGHTATASPNEVQLVPEQSGSPVTLAIPAGTTAFCNVSFGIQVVGRTSNADGFIQQNAFYAVSACDNGTNASGAGSGSFPECPVCNDNNACTTDTCNSDHTPASDAPDLACVFTSIPPCNDNNACTNDTCDAALGCTSTPIAPCNDNNACTNDTCDAVLGCVSTPIAPCNDNNACTNDTCNPATGCTSSPIAPCNDNNACTNDTCNPATGCTTTPIAPCNDNNACTNDTCNPATGCTSSPIAPCNDNNACTTDTCNPATGCATTPIAPCNDNNACTNDTCNPASGCSFTPNGSCNQCFTRTPGFWAEHPGISQAVINESGGSLPNCGILITTTAADTAGSSTEDMCSVGTDSKTNNTSPEQVQLIRQCMSAAFNLAATAGAPVPGNCEGVDPGITANFNNCCTGAGSVCDSGASAAVINASGCIGILDAFNNLETSFNIGLNQGPADPSACQASKNNGFLNPGRNLGKK